MQILDLYLPWMMYQGTKGFMWWHRGTVTFDPWSSDLSTLKFLSALYLLNKCRFWIGICRDDVFGDKGVLHVGIVVM
jgi:hypothetical protein